MIVSGEGYRGFVTSFDFLLSLEWPELDLNGAHNDVVSYRFVPESTENILRTISDSVNDGLNALVVSRIPDLDNFVCSERDQVISLLVDVKMRHRCVMSIQVRQLLKRVRLPEDDMPFFSTTCDLLMLDRVDKTVDTLLM